jgi:DNA recombination protein RmuC
MSFSPFEAVVCLGLGLALALLALLMFQLRRLRPADLAPAFDALALRWQSGAERLERELRGEVQGSARMTRSELAQGIAQFQASLLHQAGDAARTLAVAREAQDLALRRVADALNQQLGALSEANAKRLAEVRQTVELQLTTLRQGNEAKLEQMRATVDEKLHATLEQRLGESFRQVAERLELVHKGLGEMQGLARDVGSLQRVLSNVKTRGVFGELQLGALLEQVLTPEQYAKNVETVPGSGYRVEFAVRLPGREADGKPLWLPIDAKFPREDHERLQLAQDQADPVAAEAAARALEVRLRAEAKSLREKYVAAPHTTDFGILFLPTESLYAEALRRPGLMEALQRDHRITLAGPTTLLATLSSLQMGFRTLALEKRSSEVWTILGEVKTEFSKFGDALSKTRKKLEEASASIDAAEVRTRAMQRRLKGVEASSTPSLAPAAGAALASVSLPLLAEDAGPDPGGEPDEEAPGG